MAVLSFDITATRRASRAQTMRNASRETRPALVMRWEQDARGHFFCHWVLDRPVSSLSPPH
jgi:hypothetical protein